MKCWEYILCGYLLLILGKGPQNGVAKSHRQSLSHPRMSGGPAFRCCWDISFHSLWEGRVRRVLIVRAQWGGASAKRSMLPELFKRCDDHTFSQDISQGLKHSGQNTDLSTTVAAPILTPHMVELHANLQNCLFILPYYTELQQRDRESSTSLISLPCLPLLKQCVFWQQEYWPLDAT